MPSWHTYDDDHPDRTGPSDHNGETLYWVAYGDGEVRIAQFNDYVWQLSVGYTDMDVAWWSEIEYPDPPAAAPSAPRQKDPVMTPAPRVWELPAEPHCPVEDRHGVVWTRTRSPGEWASQYNLCTNWATLLTDRAPLTEVAR